MHVRFIFSDAVHYTLTPAVQPDWLSSAGSAASIAGLLLTIWVLLTVRRLRDAYIAKARVPELLEKLSEHTSELSTYLNDPHGSADEIRLVLGRVLVSLKLLKKKVDPDMKRSVEQTRRLVADAKPSVPRARIRLVYEHLVILVEELRGYQADKEWEL